MRFSKYVVVHYLIGLSLLFIPMTALAQSPVPSTSKGRPPTSGFGSDAGGARTHALDS